MSLHKPIEDTPVFALLDEASDQIWDLVVEWEAFAKWTLGKQLVAAADSVPANLVEGDGRFTDADANKFFITARASARETRHWLRKAVRRKLLDQEVGAKLVQQIGEGTKSLNGLINYRRQSGLTSVVKEDEAVYLTE